MSRLLAVLLRLPGSAAMTASLALAAGLFVISGSLLESAVDNSDEVRRLARADVVVGGVDSVEVHSAGGSERIKLPAPAPVSVDAQHATHEWAAENNARVIADYVTPGMLFGTANAQLEVHAWSALYLTETGTASTPPPRQAEVVLEDTVASRAGLEIGDRARLRDSGRVLDLKVVGTVPDAGGERAVYLSDDVAAALAGPQRPTLLGVLTPVGSSEAARDELRAAIEPGDAIVASAGERAEIEHPERSRGRAGLASLGGSLVAIVVLVSLVVVSGTSAALTENRRRDLVLLRSLAATPRELLRAMVLEGVVLGVIGCLVGLPAGLVGSRVLGAALQLVGVLPEGVDVAAGPVVVVASAGLVLALIATVRWWGIRELALSPPARLRWASDTGRVEVRRSRVLLGWFGFLAGMSACCSHSSDQV